MNWMRLATRVAYEAIRAYAAEVEDQRKPAIEPFHRADPEVVKAISRNMLVYLLNPSAGPSAIYAQAMAADPRAGEEPWQKQKWEQLPTFLRDCDSIQHALAAALRNRIPSDELEMARQMAAPKPEHILLS